MVAAIGNAEIRRYIQQSISAERPVTLIHPNAVVSDAQIGHGTVVKADTVIGEGCIINTSSSVGRDCQIGSYVHFAVGAYVAGSVKIGDETWIRAGAMVSINVTSCAGCMIGVGVAVVRDITKSGLIGIPAKMQGGCRCRRGSGYHGAGYLCGRSGKAFAIKGRLIYARSDSCE